MATSATSGTRLDLATGVFLLGGTAVFLWAFGPAVVFSSALSIGVVVTTTLAGVFSLLASQSPTLVLAGRRLDGTTLRGGSQVSLGVAFALLGSEAVAGGDSFGLVIVVIGVFTVGVGLGTVVRLPALVGRA